MRAGVREAPKTDSARGRGIEMRILKQFALVAAGLGVFLALPGQQVDLHGQQRGGRGAGGRAQAPPPLIAWAPMPAQPIQWIPPNKPIWKLKDLLAKHKGEQ